MLIFRSAFFYLGLCLIFRSKIVEICGMTVLPQILGAARHFQLLSLEAILK